MADSLALPYSVETTNPVPVVKTLGPWPSLAAARAGVKQGVRHDGLTVKIEGDGEYWWLADDLSDTGLIRKTANSNPGTGGGISNTEELVEYTVTAAGAQQIPVPANALGGLSWVLITPENAEEQREQILDPKHYDGAPVNGFITLNADANVFPGNIIRGWVRVPGGTDTGTGGVTKEYVDAQDRKKVEFYQPGRPAYADVLYYGTGFAGTGFYKPKNNIGTSNVITAALFTFESAGTVDFNHLTQEVQDKLGLSGNLQPYYVTSNQPPRAYNDFDEAVEDELGASILIFTPGTESYTDHPSVGKDLVGIGITPNVEIYGQFNRPHVIQNVFFGVFGPTPCELDGSAKFVGAGSTGNYHLTSNGIELRDKHQANWGVITAVSGFDIRVKVEAGSTVTYTSKPNNVFFDFEEVVGGGANYVPFGPLNADDFASGYPLGDGFTRARNVFVREPGFAPVPLEEGEDYTVVDGLFQFTAGSDPDPGSRFWGDKLGTAPINSGGGNQPGEGLTMTAQGDDSISDASATAA